MKRVNIVKAAMGLSVEPCDPNPVEDIDKYHLKNKNKPKIIMEYNKEK